MKNFEKSKKLRVKSISFFIACAIIFASIFSVGCRTTPNFMDFPAIWSCNEDDIQLRIITTGKYEEYNRGVLILDGEEFGVFLFGWRNYIDIYKLSDLDVVRDLKANYNDTSDYVLLKVICTGYRKSVTFTIDVDRTNRENKESLVGRKLVLERHALY